MSRTMHRWVTDHGDLTACGIHWWNGTRGEEPVNCASCLRAGGADGKRPPPCPRCAEWDAVPVGNGPKRSAALKAMGRSFAVHTCGLAAGK